MATEFLLGPMAGNMKDSGKMISSMAEAFTSIKRMSKGLAFGRTGKEFNGLKSKKSKKSENFIFIIIRFLFFFIIATIIIIIVVVVFVVSSCSED